MQAASMESVEGNTTGDRVAPESPSRLFRYGHERKQPSTILTATTETGPVETAS